MHVAIVGGGVIGCSVAWHLLKAGLEKVTVLERDRLGSGTTWHSAGNITWKPIDDNDAPVRYMLDMLQMLEAEADQPTGWLQTGRLYLARRTQTLEAFAAQAREASERGVEFQMLEPGDVPAHHPLVSPDAIAGAWLNPISGRLNPNDLTQAYARAARRRGARIIEHCPVSELVIDDNRITSIQTAEGPIEVDALVVSAGLWSRSLLQPLDLSLAQMACEHFYVIASPQPALSPNTPSFVCPEHLIYGREEVGGLLCGCFDEHAKVIDADDLPEPFAFTLLNPEWDKFAPHFEGAIELFPALEPAPIKHFINGPESFTPDGNPLIGPLPGLEGLYVCTGMNSHGVTLSAAAGAIVADMICARTPRFDPSGYAPDRFGDRVHDERWLRAAVSDAPSGYYRQANAVTETRP